ncbi:purine nucleoside phosphorylase isoform X3 [Hermetia illucens]|uniref:purine nucleoside phosphorylase isoform X3 n=1 Tax=Hermetia illucens TaxID=343691 RepID=UPI0018CC4DAB|nr:purine nucleoside phosphorylase isoform X3 [Hermetia illucens]
MTGYKNGIANGTNGHGGEVNGQTKNAPAYTAIENSLTKRQQSLVKDDYHVKGDVAFDEIYSYEIIKEIADYLLEKTSIRPKIGVICGSGLNSLADFLTQTDAFPYESIPHFPISTVEGHVGRMVFGYLEGVPVMCMQGRFHYYEGYPLSKCSMPVRVMKLVGCTHLLATNAAGGLNTKFKVGDIMLVRDHVNMMGLAGNSPLQGPNDPRFGPRFPPMTNAYDKELIKIAKKISVEMGIEKNIHQGVYTCLGGPNYETVAELRMLRTLGVDAVGMSTVHEVITARHCDLTVFAFSLITNKCPSDYDSDEDEANHEEVVSVGKQRQNLCAELMCKMVRAINESPQCK